MSPVPADPRPISSSLEQRMREALAKIQSGKRGQLTATVTNTGVEVSVAHRFDRLGKPTVSGWTGREWGGKGWSAGARSAWSW